MGKLTDNEIINTVSFEIMGWKLAFLHDYLIWHDPTKKENDRFYAEWNPLKNEPHTEMVIEKIKEIRTNINTIEELFLDRLHEKND